MKKVMIILGIGLVIGLGVVYYIFNMPQRDVQSTDIDYTIEATALVNEYLTDANSANTKYLAEDGDSKVIAVGGTVESITEDLNNLQVVLLKESSENAGVSCTFMQTTNENAKALKKGDKITIKGVIRSGATYDEDLEMYENVIIEKCDIIK